MKEQNVSVNIKLSTLLLVAFIILKLCHVIEWSWLWVLSPLWIPIVLSLIVGAIIMWMGR